MGNYRLQTTITTVLCFLQALAGICAGVSCPKHISDMKKTHRAVYRDTCYLFVNKEVFWRTAKDACWDLGGEMLTIKDQGTMDWFKDKLNSKELGWRRNGVWLGLHYHRRVWTWTDGTLPTYTNWASGQPSKVLKFLSMEDCGQMRRDDDWQWHDYVCGGMKFHFNFICQFPAEVANTTTSTATTSLSASASKSKRKESDVSSSKQSSPSKNDEMGEMLSDSNGESVRSRNSTLYQRLGHNVYRLLTEKGMSSKSLVKLIQESAMGENEDVTDPEQATSRVSGNASNQQEDNGNMKIVIIVISLSSGFLFILLIIFLLMWRHNKRVKAKAARRAVRYENNYPSSRQMGGGGGGGGGGGAAIGGGGNVAITSRLVGGLDQRPPPPIPATRPPPIDDTYLAPKDINGLYTEVLRPNGTSAHSANHNSYHVVTPSSTVTSNNHQQNSNTESNGGALCGRGNHYESEEERSPLIPGHSATSNNNDDPHFHQNGTAGTAANGPTESCACAVVSDTAEHDEGSEYIAMSSLGSKGSDVGSSTCGGVGGVGGGGGESNGKTLDSEDKHTYSNIHLEGGKDSGVVENLYESLP